MTPGDALLVHGTLPPAHIRTRRYFDEHVLRSRAELEPPPELRRDRSRTDRRARSGGDDRHRRAEVIDLFADQTAAARRAEALAAAAATVTTGATADAGEETST
jgi:hypothetical protein